MPQVLLELLWSNGEPCFCAMLKNLCAPKLQAIYGTKCYCHQLRFGCLQLVT